MRNNKHLHTTGHPHASHRARGLLARPRVCRLAWRLCCAAVAVCLFSCDSDQPDYLEPRLTTLPATDLTRTDATLHGSATVAGETEMPQLYFRYGATEAMEQTAPAVFDDQTMVAARITGLTAATTYHYMLEGTNGRTTVRGDRMSLTTLPNAKPSLGEASIVGHGPMSVIIGYRITDDGGETITETGCLYALASAATDQQRVVLKDYRKDQERQTLLLPDLRRNTTYMIWPYATSRMGETVGEAITFTTGDALLLGEPGQLRSLMGKNLYDYSHLSIAGPLNGDDLRCLREMMGRGRDNVATAGRLSDIDLTDATIVAGGEPYDDARYAEDDVVGQGLFADCASLSKIVLPSQIGWHEEPMAIHERETPYRSYPLFI